MEPEPVRVKLGGPDDIPRLRDAVRSVSASSTPLVIELPGGVLKGDLELSLGLEYGKLSDVTIVGNGSTITRGLLQLMAANITLSNLVIDGERQDEKVLDLYASESVTLDHVAIVKLRPKDSGPGSQSMRGAYLYSTTRGVTLIIRDSLFLDNRHGIIVRGVDDEEDFASARFERVRFGANVGPEVYFGPIDRVEFLDSTRLGGTGPFANTNARTVLLSEPTELPANEATLTAWRAELANWQEPPKGSDR